MKSPIASWMGFWGSFVFHSGLLGALFWAMKSDDSANGYAADIVSTNISMEMMMATIAEEPLPEPEPQPAPEPEPEMKEEVADPTVEPEPPKPEKPKEPEKPKKRN